MPKSCRCQQFVASAVMQYFVQSTLQHTFNVIVLQLLTMLLETEPNLNHSVL